MFLQSGNKAECCGCTACQQICSHGVITMEADDDGFIFPIKNLSTCINCGLCEKVCPFSQPKYYNNTLGVYATSVKDIVERKRSSSGGLFYAIAKYVIENDGIVFGSILDEKLKVRHACAESVEDLAKMRGSKYVQSALYNTYKSVKEELVKGRLVYFTGVGCQVAGLKSYLMRDYDNLLTSDLVCHGTPNQKLFDAHICYCEKKYKGKVKDYKFRDNEKWEVCESLTIVRDSQTKIFRLPSYSLSPYLYSFMHAMTYRDSCYECPFAKLPRQGDITLADFWGAKKIFPNIDTKNGVSLILINSERGKAHFDKIKGNLLIEDSNISDAEQENQNLIEHTSRPEIRDRIFYLLRKEGYSHIAKTIFRPENYYILRIKEWLKSHIDDRILFFIKGRH